MSGPEGAVPEPLSLGEHIAVNRLMVTFLESAWRGDEDTASLTLSELEGRELPAAMGALAGMARQALASTAPEGAFLAACRALLDRAEGGES
ncbi:hypothetical protein [Pseudactinotalea sp.]|uniref:hypothetical protein n=1 Tax=Pseudactinotalea sp. TaxID=1926260 RepID=UPI003B3A91AB